MGLNIVDINVFLFNVCKRFFLIFVTFFYVLKRFFKIFLNVFYIYGIDVAVNILRIITGNCCGYRRTIR